jgi:hypothetical protein
MSPQYRVGVREVHVRHFGVMAENEDEAMRLVLERAESVTDLEFCEYSHELGSDTWSVEEEPPIQTSS